MGSVNSFKKLNIKSNDFRLCVEMPIKMAICKMNYASVPSYEKRRIAGKKKVNAFKNTYVKYFDRQVKKALEPKTILKADPKHASTYEANAHKMMEKLDTLTAELREELEPVHEKGFIVFHDAYQYFEQRFDVAAIGSITVSPEVMPGAERVNELREKILELNATCIFSEPQFQPKLVETIVEGTEARTGVLDPLGASLNKGPDLYFQLLRNMTLSLKKCLSGQS